MSTLFKPPSVKLLHNVSCFIFAPLFPHRKFVCICFNSSRTEFGIDVSNATYTILKIMNDLKIEFKHKYFGGHKNIYCLEAFYYEICTLSTLLII